MGKRPKLAKRNLDEAQPGQAPGFYFEGASHQNADGSSAKVHKPMDQLLSEAGAKKPRPDRPKVPNAVSGSSQSGYPHNSGSNGGDNGGSYDMPEAYLGDLGGSGRPETPKLGPCKKSYLEMFVKLLPLLLRAILLCENPWSLECAVCTKPARYRCQDCFGDHELLCRRCIRHRHSYSPFHRAKFWNGSHFETIDLAKVGVKLVVKHREGKSDCMKEAIRALEKYEERQDETEFLSYLACGIPPETSTSIHPRPFEELESSEQPVDPEEYAGQAEEEDLGREETITPSFSGSYPVVRVYDVNGLHSLPLVTCSCRGPIERIVDCVSYGLFPATWTNPYTFFRIKMLNDLRLSNFECKTSVYQYSQKLRRATDEMHPNSTPDRYGAIRLAGRAWRHVETLRRYGYVLNIPEEGLPAGSLTSFCATCPQPGVNLPDDWHKNADSFIYTRRLAVDGNHTADHIRSASSKDDFWLAPGSGMFPPGNEYSDFLEKASNSSTNAPCENRFRVISKALMRFKHTDISGIVAWVCARHGCFCPQSPANLYRGEQQKNVDWGLLQSIKTTKMKGLKHLLIFYDIACQYSVKLMERIGHLLPKDFALDYAIGLFHVHGHKEDCLWEFSPAFIPGAAASNGEILERLWAILNMISAAARTASLSYREELLGDHLNDGNFKKIIGAALTVIRAFLRAQDHLQDAKEYLQKLTARAGELAKEWEKEIAQAESERKENRASMQVMKTKREVRTITTGKGPDSATGLNVSVEQVWMDRALDLEQEQLALKEMRRASDEDPSLLDVLDIRRRAAILTFEDLVSSKPSSLEPWGEDAEAAMAPTALPDDDGDRTGSQPQSNGPDASSRDRRAAAGGRKGRGRKAAAAVDAVNVQKPEEWVIPFPSNDKSTTPEACHCELTQRVLKMDKLLDSIRDAIANKSMEYRHVIQGQYRKSIKTRSRSAVKRHKSEIKVLSMVYNANRSCLAKLGGTQELLETYPTIKKGDTQGSSLLLDPNQRSTSDLKLSWIWQVGIGDSAAKGTLSYNTACENEFVRVHWLRARACMQRWEEELELTKHEMRWTGAFYRHECKQWEKRAADMDKGGGAVEAGAVAFCKRRAAEWSDLAKEADIEFSKVYEGYEPLAAPSDTAI